MPRTQKRATGIATIDVALVTIEVGEESGGTEYMLDTAVQVQVATQTETTDPIKLIIKNILRAQKPGATVVTGTTITLTDNVFTPELVKILQGGEIEEDSEGDLGIKKYTPPVIGSSQQGEKFTLNTYSAVYTPAGTISKYEKTSYPNCQGVPIEMSSEDDVFRVGEYTINSYPDTGQAPYIIEWVKELPSFPEESSLMEMSEVDTEASNANHIENNVEMLNEPANAEAIQSTSLVSK